MGEHIETLIFWINLFHKYLISFCSLLPSIMETINYSQVFCLVRYYSKTFVKQVHSIHVSPWQNLKFFFLHIVHSAVLQFFFMNLDIFQIKQRSPKSHFKDVDLEWSYHWANLLFQNLKCHSLTYFQSCHAVLGDMMLLPLYLIFRSPHIWIMFVEITRLTMLQLVVWWFQQELLIVMTIFLWQFSSVVSNSWSFEQCKSHNKHQTLSHPAFAKSIFPRDVK